MAYVMVLALSVEQVNPGKNSCHLTATSQSPEKLAAITKGEGND